MCTLPLLVCKVTSRTIISFVYCGGSQETLVARTYDSHIQAWDAIILPYLYGEHAPLYDRSDDRTVGTHALGTERTPMPEDPLAGLD